jgi:hypothetical protein
VFTDNEQNGEVREEMGTSERGRSLTEYIGIGLLAASIDRWIQKTILFHHQSKFALVKDANSHHGLTHCAI